MTSPSHHLSRRNLLAASAAVVVSFAAASCTPPRGSESPTPAPASRGPRPSASDPWRPAVHLTAEKNWLNDPNGLLYHDGTYHAFYQYNPRGNSWGNMSWGHSTSKDLVHWEQQPVAMEASVDEEIFSGCIVVDTNNASGLGSAQNPPLVALYTSAYGKNGALPQGAQAQSAAYSTDGGTTWQKHRGNPVLNLEPTNNNFRDPKVTWYEPGRYWVMTTVVADAQVVKLFKSTDLLHWDFLSDFSGVGAQGGLWEVPELLQMSVEGSTARKWVMLLSINPGGIAGGSGMQYFVGEFDGTRFMAEDAAAPDAPLQESQWLDYGADYYAANSVSGAPGGKPVLLGWMGNWDYAQHVPTTPWRGAMAIPRELTLVRGEERFELRSGIAAAAREVLERGEETSKDLTVSSGSEDLGTDFAARTQLIDLELDLGTAREAGILLRHSPDAQDGLRISYEKDSGTLKVDRSNTGTSNFSEKFSPCHQVTGRPADGKVRLRILLDTSSVEVFAQDGQAVVTDTFFPDWDHVGASVFSMEGETAFAVRSRAL
ncbi:glycoside hydrolase family 32 protein [Paenarthrobacter sp. AT5]|uniref:glycoside hydrolase family 32 protein n=1 Tax=Paenarthrobacter TaxID=1742992 RepID=UPI001A99CA9F|nr:MULTISPECIES: glycoside hydrolase family 32 protein [Paenarthrobacter]QSZ54728.1 levanase [Paenarthrobacter ureafaciens]WOC62240.1 glycoside hydrolase family 32 protein [Paenarthrobacter sp. AT5]